MRRAIANTSIVQLLSAKRWIILLAGEGVKSDLPFLGNYKILPAQSKFKLLKKETYVESIMSTKSLMYLDKS